MCQGYVECALLLTRPRHPAVAGSVLVAIAAGSGCVTQAPAPEPEQVLPDKGWSGAAQEITIEGRNFIPSVLFDARGGETVNRTFQAELRDDEGHVVALERVSLLDVTELTARVPELGFDSGIPSGMYDLVITGPDDQVGILEDAYLISDTRADHFSVTSSDGRTSWTVNDRVVFDVSLLDPVDVEVHESLPVRIAAVAVDGSSADIAFATEAPILLDQEAVAIPGGVMVEGRLFLDGSAEIPLVVSAPSEVLLTISALDEASGVEPTVLDLSWHPGTAYDVEIELPADPMVARSGQPFTVGVVLRDEFGNVVDRPLLPVNAILTDSCGDMGSVSISGFSGRVERQVTLNRATDTDACGDQQLKVLVGDQEFTSDWFEVLPGSATRFEVRTAASEVTAGRPLVATVRPVDGFGNATTWEGEASDLLLSDSIGDVEALGCTPGDVFMICTVTPTDAEREVVLQVDDPHSDLSGASSPYRVLAAGLDYIEVEPAPEDLASDILAGETFDALVHLYDEFGNDVPAERYVEGDVQVTDVARGDLGCLWLGPAERGELAFSCAPTVAETVRLRATGPDDIVGESVVFPVVNNALAQVTLDADTRVVAGTGFDLLVEGFDAWGNPYVVGGARTVGLSDASGTLSVDHVTLDGVGRAEVEAFLTRAGITVLVGRSGGLDLGVSDPIEVTAAGADSLEVRLGAPWGWAGEDLPVHVRAVDAWGNPADLDEDVRLATDAGSAAAVEGALVDGRGALTLLPDGGSTSEVVRARSESGILGASAPFMIARSCADSGPVIHLDFSGELDARTCHDGTEALVRGRFVGSSGSPVAYALWVDGQPATLSSSSTVDVTVDAIGTFDAAGLVVDAEGCGDEVYRTAWVGPDDGQPVGPISVSLSNDSLAVGASTTSISLAGVQSCDGDPARNGKVFLRTDRGEVTSVVPTGSGLRLTLDSLGDGSAVLDMTGADTGGNGLVSAWVASGAASGSASFRATGDKRRPTVLDQDPVGYTEGEFDVIVVTTSEPVSSGTAVPSAFTVSGPGAPSVESVVLDGNDIEIWLDGLYDAADGRYAVTVGAAVTDLAGNGLDGARTGSASAWTGAFGNVSAAAPDVTACTLSTAVFRPDGDDGSGVEADTVSLAVTADRTVEAWRMDIYDPFGERVFVDRFAGSSSSLSWSGRDLEGRVVDDGIYTLSITASNADGTLGEACAASVVVDNHRGT